MNDEWECECNNIGYINNEWLCLECGEKIDEEKNEEQRENK